MADANEFAASTSSRRVQTVQGKKWGNRGDQRLCARIVSLAALVVVAALTVGAGLAYAGTGGAAVPAQAENTCNESGDGWEPKVDKMSINLP